MSDRERRPGEDILEYHADTLFERIQSRIRAIAEDVGNGHAPIALLHEEESHLASMLAYVIENGEAEEE